LSVMLMIRRQIQIGGIVQGVGFRPFIYNLAQGLGLKGYVLNSSRGVTIEAEGPGENVERFLQEVVAHPPPLAQIDAVGVSEIEANGDTAFEIRESKEEPGQFALVPADMATCAACQRDFRDPANRRYRYPFTNCTDCGPRYTIIRDIPYDRPLTTMMSFGMCPECHAEYENPADRRFQAQPNACPVCGPWLELCDKQGRVLAGHDEALCRARQLLREGNILGIKGLGGFHLACDATDDKAVHLLRERKRRSDKPFALMARDLVEVERLCFVSDAERSILETSQRPIVILERRPGVKLSSAVAPGNRTLGVMLPYTPLHHLLFGDDAASPPLFDALVMTSGNMSEEPIVSRNEEAITRLTQLCDFLLLHNRDIQTRVDDSVIRAFDGKERLIRRSRAYAPLALDLGGPVEEVVAFGGELKNTFCLTKHRYAILSQHIGDLENLETLEFFEETLEHMRRFFRVTPKAVAHDLHPGFMTTQLALRQDAIPRIGVQHHHAHIVSCMAENHVDDRVIGVALDGTGYGTDGQIWGGEFLICDRLDFARRAHFRYVALPGGDTAIRRPWRIALSYLRDCFGPRIPSDVPWLQRVRAKEIEIVDRMIDRRVNTVQTSSCGRLFDAVASLIGLRDEINFEGQAAIELEMITDPDTGGHYPFEISKSGDVSEIDFRPMIRDIVRDILDARDPGVISAYFHNAVTSAVIEMCQRLRVSEGLHRVCLSGGSFQNLVLLSKAVAGLRKHGFEVFLHSRVPANDGGLSLGQAVVASEWVRRGGGRFQVRGPGVVTVPST
jgi:hydrogenase maturation protein HypF